MHPIAIRIIIAALALLPFLRPAVAATASQPAALAIVDLDYLDTSGEVRDQSQEHRQFVAGFTQALAQELAASGHYRIVPLACGAQPCTSRDNPLDLQKAARAAGVRFVLLGGFHKMSTLIQWAKIEIIDADKGNVALDRLVTFRNDTREAWTQAAAFLFREIMAAGLVAGPGAEPKPAVKLAVFDFELEDFSGGAGLIPESADDRADLQEATDDVRQLLAKSGRYTLVPVGSADAAPVKAHELRKCDGCDAAIARTLGADQSLVGIVTRITRTDYAVTYKLRDAQTGKVIDVEQTDLRIGANYSWNRGAVWLIKRRLLKDNG